MNTKSDNPVRRAYRRYFVEFWVSMVGYVGVILGSRWLLRGPLQHVGGGWQMVLALSPLVPVLFVFAAIVRLVRKTDELQRRVYVESLAIAGGATALLAVTYGLMEGEQLPNLSAWWTYGVFMSSWLVATFFVKRRYR